MSEHGLRRACPVCRVQFTLGGQTGQNAWRKHLAKCRARKRVRKKRRP